MQLFETDKIMRQVGILRGRSWGEIFEPKRVSGRRSP